MQRIIRADNVDDAFREEGYAANVAAVVRDNKSFKATRSLRQKNVTNDVGEQADKMSHRQGD